MSLKGSHKKTGDRLVEGQARAAERKEDAEIGITGEENAIVGRNLHVSSSVFPTQLRILLSCDFDTACRPPFA